MRTLDIHEVTDRNGNLVGADWLQRAEPVHRQLRDKLPGDYRGKMKRVFAQGGRMCVAASAEAVLGVAVYRIHENTHDGVKMYVDDLVTDAAARSTGVGRALMQYLERVARDHACEWLTLDSGTQRHRAHAFYFRAGMSIASYAFRKKL